MKKIIKKILGRNKTKDKKWAPEGKAFYDPNKKMTFQGYFDRNRESITKR